jgi:ankyrin repeat protein
MTTTKKAMTTPIPASKQRVKIEPRLVAAVKSGDRQRVYRCVNERGVNVNGQDRDNGSSALHIATNSNQVGSFLALVQSGADLLLTDNNGDTVLNLAIKRSLEFIWREALEKCPAAARISDTEGKTPLHNADAEAVDMLLDSGACDINAKTTLGETALYLAVSRNETNKALRLLARLADVNIVTGGPRNTALHLAAALNNIKLVENLLLRGADPSVQDSRGRTPLHYAAQVQSIDVLELLVANAHPSGILVYDEDGRSPIHFIHSLPGAVALLVCKGHDALNRRDRTCLTPLHLASRSATPEVVKALIKRGASIDGADGDGRTPAEALCRDKRFWLPKGSSNASPVGARLCSGDIIDNTLMLSEQHRLDTLAALQDKWSDRTESCREGLKAWKTSCVRGNKKQREIISNIEDILDQEGAKHMRVVRQGAKWTASGTAVVASLAVVGPAGTALLGTVGAVGYAGVSVYGYVSGMSKREIIGHLGVHKVFHK